MKEPKDTARKLPRPPYGGKAAGRLHQAEEAFGLEEDVEEQPKKEPGEGLCKEGENAPGEGKKR
jgi:hypothetical protein